MIEGFNARNYVLKIMNGSWKKSDIQYRFTGKKAEEILKTIMDIKDEDHQLDFKFNISVSEKLGKLASVFSNYQGGAIVFGIKEEAKTASKVEGRQTLSTIKKKSEGW